jgi:hypothetical protein
MFETPSYNEAPDATVKTLVPCSLWFTRIFSMYTVMVEDIMSGGVSLDE